MIRKILHIVLALILTVWLTVIMGFVHSEHEAVICNAIRVEIQDSLQVRFVTDHKVREILDASGINTQGYPVLDINTRQVEALLEENPYVKSAEVYVNIDGNLFIELDQRRPVMRILGYRGENFYVDEEGMILPPSESYAPILLLVTGYLNLELDGEESNERLKVEEDSPEKVLLNFARFVEDDPFWKSQVVQIYRAKNGDFEIIPRVGAHQIILGSLDSYDQKLKKLKLLYEQGLPEQGWNQYDKINLKYSNQVICTKR